VIINVDGDFILVFLVSLSGLVAEELRLLNMLAMVHEERYINTQLKATTNKFICITDKDG
jgi:hypothetical protein